MELTRRTAILAGACATVTTACAGRPAAETSTFGIETFSDEMNSIIDGSAEIEQLAQGYTWCEGPTWDRARNVLYFTDVPQNTAYRWSEADGVEVFLSPSGAAGLEGFREPGANGLWYAADGTLIICNHGRRGVERMNLETTSRDLIADRYDGRLFNSPNDVVEAKDRGLFFTDPPYGLEGLDASPLKQQDANGVYHVSDSGLLTRLVEDMTFPNGVALSPDERTLYVSQSDPNRPIIRAFELSADGAIESDRVLFDASALMNENAKGLPDGMAVCSRGNLFATGPGGVLVISPEGALLGRILTGRATANCAFGEDGRTLFMTAHDRLLKVRTNSLGLQWS
ncbi:MAG: SMP-30/gluconolactonase/LRE family protein [Pseudomonadota bacterium]